MLFRGLQPLPAPLAPQQPWFPPGPLSLQAADVWVWLSAAEVAAVLHCWQVSRWRGTPDTG